MASNYPLGVTDEDIDRAFGERAGGRCAHDCRNCGREEIFWHDRVDVDEDGPHELRCEWYDSPRELYCADCLEVLVEAVDCLAAALTGLRHRDANSEEADPCPTSKR